MNKEPYTAFIDEIYGEKKESNLKVISVCIAGVLMAVLFAIVWTTLAAIIADMIH